MPEEKNLHHPGLMPACPGRTVQGAGKGHEGAQGSHVCLRLSAGKEEQKKIKPRFPSCSFVFLVSFVVKFLLFCLP